MHPDGRIDGRSNSRLDVWTASDGHRYGCRYDAASGALQGYLFEKDCDDKKIQLDCGYLCLDP